MLKALDKDWSKVKIYNRDLLEENKISSELDKLVIKKNKLDQ